MNKEINHFQNALERSIAQFFFASQIDESKYLVINLENHQEYTVGVKNGLVFTCNCPHHEHRGVVCKHMIRVCNEFEFKIPM